MADQDQCKICNEDTDEKCHDCGVVICEDCQEKHLNSDECAHVCIHCPACCESEEEDSPFDFEAGRSKGFIQGIAYAAAELCRGWGASTQAEHLLQMADLDSLESLEKAGIDEFDVEGLQEAGYFASAEAEEDPTAGTCSNCNQDEGDCNCPHDPEI